MNRRSFVQSSLAAPAAASAVPSFAAAAGGDIPKRTFGKTGEKLTIIGQAGGRFPLCSFEDAVAITKRACDLGINYLDNAHIYWGGKSEEVFGAAITPAMRKKVFITSKTMSRSRAKAESDLAESLKRLKTDYVDLWQIHDVRTSAEIDEIFGAGGALEAMVAAKKAGKCRFFGFTGHHDPAMHVEMLKRYDQWDTILMPLNAADPGYLSFEKQVLPIAVERGMGIQGMKSTANAKLLQRFSIGDCLRYTLSLPIHCLAIGCTTIGQLEDDVRIAKSFAPLTSAQMDDMRKRADGLKGPGLEDWKKNVQTASDRVYLGG
jgi:predicted aldo/keto reductase-like oxidoreductase